MSKLPSCSACLFRFNSKAQLALSTTVLLAFPFAISPAIARQSVSVETQLTPASVIDATVLLAQANANSVLYFRTNNYTVHVFREAGQNRMNVYNNAIGVVQQNRAVATLQQEQDFTIFSSRGFRDGLPATYRALLSSSDRLSLQILDAAGQVMIQENAIGDVLDNVSSNQRPTGQAVTETILAFETTSYSARVFRRDGQPQYFMNVHNKVANQTEQNGVPAQPSAPAPPNDRQVSYVSSGNYNNIPAQYFMRIDDRGQTVLEIISESGQRLFQEPGVGPVTVNIPQSDIPAGVDRIEYVNTAYVVAVFGEGSTLSQVQQLYPEAFAENSGLGDFINAGSFADRNLAMARVLELRGRGFNSRLVYRDVRYR